MIPSCGELRIGGWSSLSPQTINQMKNAPAIISLATVGALLILAVASSLVDSIPLALIACYIVAFSGSIAFLATFMADYGPRSPEAIRIVAEDPASDRWAEVHTDVALSEQLTVSILSTGGLHEAPATLSVH